MQESRILLTKCWQVPLPVRGYSAPDTVLGPGNTEIEDRSLVFRVPLMELVMGFPPSRSPQSGGAEKEITANQPTHHHQSFSRCEY